MRPSGAGLENVHFLEYTFVLDIHCQQLGKMCQLEGICAPFRRGVGECAFSRIYICIGYTQCQQLGQMCRLEGVSAALRAFGRGFWECEFLEYTFVLDLHCQKLGNMCQLEGVCAPFGRGFWECEFLEYTFVTPTVIDRPVPELGEVGSRVAAASCLLLNK